MVDMFARSPKEMMEESRVWRWRVKGEVGSYLARIAAVLIKLPGAQRRPCMRLCTAETEGSSNERVEGKKWKLEALEGAGTQSKSCKTSAALQTMRRLPCSYGRWSFSCSLQTIYMGYEIECLDGVTCMNEERFYWKVRLACIKPAALRSIHEAKLN
jgi:hypothetical protein